MALVSSRRVFQCLRSSSSFCIDDQKLSIIARSNASPTEPRSSFARLRISTSASNSRMRFFARRTHRLCRRSPGGDSSIDPVLFDPVIEGAVGDAEIGGSLRDGLARFDERDGPSSELGRIGMWHGLSPSSRPELNK